MTIDFGIDLGTTNSSIAVWKGSTTEVIKNEEGWEQTPSAIFVDRHGDIRCGRRAKERIEEDSENAFAEFKLQMGRTIEYTFARSGRRMKPEELSAEILKSLRRDVVKRLSEEPDGAVITIPAAFEAPQRDATKRAATLAGFVDCPLLQEPVAAAYAYGFQHHEANAYWLVYDLGGGTFDAAVIQIREGYIEVVNHGGDNHLGGKLLDWAIVDELFIPALVQQHRLPDFQRGNPRWKSAITKLKSQAEQAKIWLSHDSSAEIVIQHLCRDSTNEDVRFEYELQRRDVERLAEPILLRTVGICKKVLQEKRLSPKDITNILLVGGPTLSPFLRELIADPNDGLGIPVEHGEDPMTVVARGAAIFAGTQRIHRARSTATEPASSAYRIAIEHDSVGPSRTPFIGGRVLTEREGSLLGLRIRIHNPKASPPWMSGWVSIGASGGFTMRLQAEAGKENVYQIELCDATGLQLESSPKQFVYVVGPAMPEAPLTHSIGVALDDNSMDWLIQKGTPLPARGFTSRRTKHDFRPDREGHVLQIPLMEGQRARADRNARIGTLQIKAGDLPRALPAGSEVQITVEVDSSHILTAEAYFPSLSAGVKRVLSYEEYRLAARNPEVMQSELSEEHSRLQTARTRAENSGAATTLAVLERIDRERIVPEIERYLAAARLDPDAADKCEKRLLDLKLAVDELEALIEWPQLVADAENELAEERKLIGMPGLGATTNEVNAFHLLEADLRRAIGRKDAEAVRATKEELDRLGFGILCRHAPWWRWQLEWIQQRSDSLTDPTAAKMYFADAESALRAGDIEALRNAVISLNKLRPHNDQALPKVISDVMR